VSGVSELLETNDRIIVLEDDIVPSRTFLTFMNEGLAACESRNDIYQISGYFVPHRVDLPDLGLLRVPACWGWATWRRAWAQYTDDAATLVDALAGHDKRKFDIDGTYDYMESLEKNARGEANTWFVRWYATVFLRGGLTVYPARSLARNVGFVEGGTNCGPGRTAQTFLRQRIDNRRKNFTWETLGTDESPEYAEVLAGFYRWQQHEWTRPTWRERVDARVKLLMGRGR
jgi:hypothetical protein